MSDTLRHVCDITVHNSFEKATMAPPFMDALTTDLNPCSLESIPTPLKLADDSQIWPLMLSCYQLEASKRLGQINFYAVQVPEIASNESSMPLKLGDPVKMECSGVLDGKWTRIRSNEYAFASAHANGTIQLYRLTLSDERLLESEPLYRIQYMGKSKVTEEEPMPLCLSLHWEDPSLQAEIADRTDRSMQRLVSTYSNGTVAIHDVLFSENETALIQRDCWNAHSLFTAPSEVWSACFATNSSENVVLSGGDEGSCKIWDVRCTNRPMQVLKHFEAGVTCVSPHPRVPHLVACGSYDETLCLLDMRHTQQPLCRSRKAGGGIWRIKWHPYNDRRVLVAAMHGGCRVFNVKGFYDYLQQQEQMLPTPPVPLYAPPSILPSASSSSQDGMYFKLTKKFTEHESMAYGADWLVCRHPNHRNSYFEAAASCSFYDRAAFVWDSIF
jgi:diphthamide biosynthesis protein 7